jgi:O-acetyl-ADP-ribose deacetylase (regulator of RNase III)
LTVAEPNIPKIEADAIFHATMTCLPAITQAYRYFHAQGKNEDDFDRCAREAMTKAVRNAVELTAREVKDPVWPYALDDAAAGVALPDGAQHGK